MEFCEKVDETTSSQKTNCQTLVCPTASFMASGEFKFKLFQNACMVYKHAVVAAFRIYAQLGEDAIKGEFGGRAFNSLRNYIVDHGKSWKNHGIVFLNFCGNPVIRHTYISFLLAALSPQAFLSE